MICKVVNEDFIQASPRLATVGRATAQFAGKLLALERRHQSREHEDFAVPDSGGSRFMDVPQSTSDSGLAVNLQGEYWPDNVQWTGMWASASSPRLAGVCDHEPMTGGL